MPTLLTLPTGKRTLTYTATELALPAGYVIGAGDSYTSPRVKNAFPTFPADFKIGALDFRLLLTPAAADSFFLDMIAYTNGLAAPRVQVTGGTMVAVAVAEAMTLHSQVNQGAFFNRLDQIAAPAIAAPSTANNGAFPCDDFILILRKSTALGAGTFQNAALTLYEF